MSKVVVNFKGIVINQKSEDYEFNGNKGTTHRVSIDSYDECGTYRCSEDVAKALHGVKYKNAEFTAEVQDTIVQGRQSYGFRIIGVNVLDK